MNKMNIIILAGMPATGKSTIAAELKTAFGYPVLEKDHIKEGLFDTLGFENYARKRQLDIAANETLLRWVETLLKAGVSMIIDNNFDAQSGEKLRGLVDAYKPNCVTVFLGGDTDVLYRRYADRDNRQARHIGHVVQDHYPLLPGESTYYTMARDEFDEKFVKRGMGSFSCGDKRIDLDATDFKNMDIPRLIGRIREELAD